MIDKPDHRVTIRLQINPRWADKKKPLALLERLRRKAWPDGITKNTGVTLTRGPKPLCIMLIDREHDVGAGRHCELLVGPPPGLIGPKRCAEHLRHDDVAFGRDRF